MDNRLQAIPPPTMTDREREILRLLADGMTDAEIAELLVLTVGTVKWYNRQIYGKLGVRNRSQAIAAAQQMGILDAQPQIIHQAPTNLPAQVTSFIGREREIKAVTSMLADSRLVTLTGSPGTGKTRLALEAASSILPRFRDGVFVVWLASLQDAELVAQSIAQALGIVTNRTEDVAAAIKHGLRDKHLLLVLDNFEHVLAAAPLVSDLLAAAPQVTVLTTSRESLRLYGEVEYPVPPLHVPDLNQKIDEHTKQFEAVELFVQRAKAASPAFALTPENVHAVATICVHVDGLPLAIELAAARIKFIAPQTLLVRLGSRLEALTAGPRDLPARQRTLRTTLAWSYDLLDANEQVLFAWLGTFAGGFAPQDAAYICDGLGINVENGLESLYNKSLLRQSRGLDAEQRLMMLETMREFALEMLERRGESALAHERHAMYFLHIAESGKSNYFGAGEAAWLLHLEAQHDNLRAALRWTLGHDDERQLSLRLIAALAHFWEIRAYFHEGVGWLAEASKLPQNNLPTAARANAVYGIAEITYLQGAYTKTRTLLEEAMSIYTALNDQSSMANTMIALGEIASEIGDYETAIDLFIRANDIMQALGDKYGQARAATQLGFGWLRAGNLDTAGPLLKSGRDLYRSLNDRVGDSLALSGLGELAVRENNLEEAAALLEESLAVRRLLGLKWGIAATLGSLAWVAILRGETERAINLLRESLNLRETVGDRGGMAWCIEKLADIAYRRGDSSRAALLLGGADALRASIDSVVDASDQPAFGVLIENIRASLPADTFAALWGDGQRLSIKDLIDAAI